MGMQLTFDAVERIANCNVYIGVSLAHGASGADRDFSTGNSQIDRYVESSAMATMSGRPLDDDVAAGNALMKALQTIDVLAHASLDGW